VVGRLSLLLLSCAAGVGVTAMAAFGSSTPGGTSYVASHRPAAVLAALVAAHTGEKPKPRTHRRKLAAARSAGSTVSLVNQEWVCDSHVNLESVTVRMTSAWTGGRRGADAVHLESGCSGRIGRLTIRTWLADGVKVAQGAHDLTIGGGSVRCLAKLPRLHQDGIQVMGGTRVTFRGLHVDCGRAGTRLINSDLFIKRSGSSTVPPTDVVCDGCVLGGEAAHTVDIQKSVRSGVIGSRLCQAKYPRLTLTIGHRAVDPVDVRTTLGSC
jgi:hypothetical protein